MPCATPRRSDASCIEGGGNRTVGCRTRRLYLPHDGQYVRSEAVSRHSVRCRTHGLRLAQIGAVAKNGSGNCGSRLTEFMSADPTCARAGDKHT
jgi:hypothetical protein